MKKNKILILSGLKYNVEALIINAVSIAKRIDAEIYFFYVKKPTEIIGNDSQLSALRSINKEQIQTEKELENLLTPLTEKYKIDIKSKFSFGNIKTEIEDYINKINPELIIIGKRRANLFNLPGDRVTDFVLDRFSIPVLISSETNASDISDTISVGVLNTHESTSSNSVLKKLIQDSKIPLKSFKIVDKVESFNSKNSAEKGLIEYVFERNENSISSLSNYLEKSKVNLLYIERSKLSIQSSDSNKVIPLKKIINKVKVPLLIAN